MTEGRILTYATHVAVDSRTFGWIILVNDVVLVHMVIAYGTTVKLEVLNPEPDLDPDDLILDTIALFGDDPGNIRVNSRTFQVPSEVIEGISSSMSARKQNCINQIAAYYGRQEYEQHHDKSEKALIQ